MLANGRPTSSVSLSLFTPCDISLFLRILHSCCLAPPLPPPAVPPLFPNILAAPLHGWEAQGGGGWRHRGSPSTVAAPPLVVPDAARAHCDAQLDAVFSAMKQLGFWDVEIVVSETGWPSRGEAWEMGVDAEKAREYNANVVRHVTSGAGTPLMSDRKFEAFIFSLFNEDLKSGRTSERNFELFMAGMTPVYDIGILRTGNVGGGSTELQLPPPAAQAPGVGVMSWCLPKPNTNERYLQVNIDFACGQGLDCRPIHGRSSCFFPATVKAHAASVTPCWPLHVCPSTPVPSRHLLTAAPCRAAAAEVPERRSTSNYPIPIRAANGSESESEMGVSASVSYKKFRSRNRKQKRAYTRRREEEHWRRTKAYKIRKRIRRARLKNRGEPSDA
ncbi:hypothetical protein Taro_051847 [Colocasia esculenta]|uniref:X8 domain-containing protein n=1 Tax=Colocasia esculenta TaxID=4460 RepID=A0A843XI31_COLES|nr:hypothetical protein [Colocasia esculenta]